LKRIVSLLVLLGLFLGQLYSQSDYTLGLLPAVHVSVKLNNIQSLKSSIETRKLSFDNLANDQWNYQDVLTDYILYLSNKLGPDKSLNIGYTFRTRGGNIFHRISEHFNIVQRLRASRVGHRIALDQTFSNGEVPVFRLRYRATWEKSLSGERIDEKEFYTKVGTEALFNHSSETNGFEWRLVPQLGFEINTLNKVEAGIDMRLKELFKDQLETEYWFKLAWYRSIIKKNKSQS